MGSTPKEFAKNLIKDLEISRLNSIKKEYRNKELTFNGGWDRKRHQFNINTLENLEIDLYVK